MAAPTWTIINGPRRTGSTLVYNIARMLLTALTDARAHGVVAPEIADVLVVPNPRPQLVKVHNWFVTRDAGTVVHLFTWRDPADTLASHLAFPETPDEAYALVEVATGHRSLTIARTRTDTRIVHYENLYPATADGVTAIGTMLGLDVPPALATDIAAAVDVHRMREATTTGSTDAATELRRTHVSDTLGKPGRGRTLTPSQKRSLAMTLENER